MARLLSRLDPWLYRYPFEGASARRYAEVYRRGFGDLDARLLDAWSEELGSARRYLDVGCGPATLAAQVADRYPDLDVVGVEPSRDYLSWDVPRGVRLLRGRAEKLPVATASVDFAVYLSSMRHVRHRRTALHELRRVLAPGAVAFIVELDPDAARTRARAHSRRLGSAWSRMTFSSLVMRTAPPAHVFARLARDAGFDTITTCPDPLQPVYVMRLACS